MPTYDYLCDGCDHRFEVFEAMSASGRRSCPQCGKRRAKRTIAPTANVLFKGKGFYVNDYRKSPPKKDEKKPPKKKED